MKDILNKRIFVSTDGTAGPYIMVHPDSRASVEVLLRKNGIVFAADGNASSVTDVINLGSREDVEKVQALLDSVK